MKQTEEGYMNLAHTVQTLEIVYNNLNRCERQRLVVELIKKDEISQDEMDKELDYITY